MAQSDAGENQSSSGSVSEVSIKQARKEAEKKLSAVNAGKAVPYSTLSLREFVEQFFIPLAFPILKLSTRKRYLSTLDLHLLPAFGRTRLCDIKTVEVQRFILQKVREWVGLGNMQSPSQPVVENLRQCKEVGTLCGRKSSTWSGVARKTAPQEQTSAHARSDCPTIGDSPRTYSHNGPDWRADGPPRGRDSWLALARRGFHSWGTSRRAGCLPRNDWVSQDSWKQAHAPASLCSYFGSCRLSPPARSPRVKRAYYSQPATERPSAIPTFCCANSSPQGRRSTHPG